MQQTQRRIFYLLILAAGFGWILLSADKTGSSTAGQIPAPQAGFLAPDFELQTTAGETIKLSDLRGQALLVNLWATWPPPCRAEMQTLEKVYNDYQEQGFTILAVNMTYQDDPKAVTSFVEERGLTYPILLDKTGEVGRAYQMKSLPSSFFIGRRPIAINRHSCCHRDFPAMRTESDTTSHVIKLDTQHTPPYTYHPADSTTPLLRVPPSSPAPTRLPSERGAASQS